MLLGAVMLAAAASPAVAQAVADGPRVSSPGLTITIGSGDIPQIDVGYVRFGGSPVVRVWQDYVLASGREVRGAVVVAGNATIDGRVDGDLVVVLGSARLSSTAVVNGSVVVIAGDTTIAEGATIWQDLVVVGGRLTAPPSFSPGHEYFVIGAPWLGDQLRGIVPWITRG
ncbi:MAG TPA: polymer-forming cytoskeletal protein, partial [Vicinamibacterales bacterium]